MVFATLFYFCNEMFFFVVEWNERKKMGVSWQNRARWLELKGWNIRRLKVQWKVVADIFMNQSWGWWKMLGPFWKLLEAYYLHPLSNRPLQTRSLVFINGWRSSFMTLMSEFIISKAYFDGLWCRELLFSFQWTFMKRFPVRPAFKWIVHPKTKILTLITHPCIVPDL